MFIKRIGLSNYRNYKQFELELGRKCTIIIGQNGAGKTNLITALMQNLSFPFTKSRDISNPDFVANTGRSILSFGPNDAHISRTQHQALTGEWPVRVTSEYVIGGNTIECVFEKNSLMSGMKESYKPASQFFWNHYRGLENMPVFAFFSDGFPHIKGRLGTVIQRKLESEFGIGKEVGYYGWDDQSDTTQLWLQYFSMQGRQFAYHPNDTKARDYIRAIESCLVGFSQSTPNTEDSHYALEELGVIPRGKEDVVYLKFKDGRLVPFSALPAGYLRIFSIVFDIANRSYLLNGNCDPEGIVIIDEVELHLHPSLTREILCRLQRIFPKIQFIVTTHAPLVLSGVRPDEDHIVYQLAKDGTDAVVNQVMNPYGLDASSVIQLVMGTSARNQDMGKQLEHLFDYIDSNNLSQAEVLLHQLRSENDQIPELTQAQTLIDLTRNLDEED